MNTDTNNPVYSVGEFSNVIKKLVETNFSYVRIKGEISRPSFPGSGHVYFTLKDTDGTIAAIIWKYNLPRLSIKPEEGIEVICTGKVTTFAGQSKYQIIVESMEVAGEGALLKMLEEPPEGTHFILVTSQVSALLPTIRSRVQSFRFFPLSNEELKTHHQESPDWLLNLSRGQISELEFWAEEEMSEVLNQVEQGLHSLAKKDLEGWLALLPLVKDRKMFYRISKIFQFFFRDLSFEFQEGEYSLPFSKRLKSEFSWPKNGLALAWQRAFELESSIQGNADRSLLFQNFYFDLWSQAEGERL